MQSEVKEWVVTKDTLVRCVLQLVDFSLCKILPLGAVVYTLILPKIVIAFRSFICLPNSSTEESGVCPPLTSTVLINIGFNYGLVLHVVWGTLVQILQRFHENDEYYTLCIIRSFVLEVLKLMQMHPKESLRRVILTASWFNDINVGC